MKKDFIEKCIKDNLSEKRRIHTYGVRDTAVKLAEKYGADAEKAEIAALSHDLYRGLRGEELNKCVKKLGLPDRYLDNPNLAHSKIAAAMLRDRYGIEDEDILNAVSYHTTGRENMSLLEKIIYLADSIEPNRDYPGVDDLRKTASEDLDRAVLECLEHTISFLEDSGEPIDIETIKAKDYLCGKGSVK